MPQILYCSLKFPHRTELQLPTGVTRSRTHPILPPTLRTSSLPSWCFGDPFPNTSLTLNSCLRDCFWGNPNQNYIYSPEVSHCLWNCTVYAWCAVCLGSRIHSLNHSLVQKNVNGVPISCKITELHARKTAENRHRSCPQGQPIF